MRSKKCECGRILYEDVKYCPSCGRRMDNAPIYLITKEDCSKNNK